MYVIKEKLCRFPHVTCQLTPRSLLLAPCSVLLTDSWHLHNLRGLTPPPQLTITSLSHDQSNECFVIGQKRSIRIGTRIPER